jgi:S-DNA-T family DNA segregation ATPase FtsK/SpoIIIE
VIVARNREAVLGAEAKPAPRDESWLLDEVVGIMSLAGACFAALSFAAYQLAGGSASFAGRVGHALAGAVVPALGFAAYWLPAALLALAVLAFRRATEALSGLRAVGGVALVVSSAMLLALAAPAPPVHSVGFAGGWVGGFLAMLLTKAFGTPGSVLFASALLIVSVLFVTRISLGAIAAASRRGVAVAADRLRSRWQRPAAVAEPVPSAANVKREPPAPSEAPPVIVLSDEIEPPPVVVPPKPAKKRVAPVQEELRFDPDAQYRPPPLSFLDLPERGALRIDEEALRKSSQILEAKLADFGIQGRVVEVRPGPVITTFDIEPAPGVKVNRIVSLGDDLSMALRVPGVRILAPVPGKAVVGIEVANPRREEVRLREILESPPFRDSPSLLTLALGKDTGGATVVGDLQRMPHLLIAGATGSGKSVAINAMIVSMLYKASPRDLRFVMIDLKMLELSVYEDIPHLLVPVVTDPKKAVVVLKNIVEQMDERYRLMKQRGVRNIDGYNRMIEREEGERAAGVIELSVLADDDGEEPDEPVVTPPVDERLPKIVVIVDELADLMMTMGRQVEEPITRLAQKARAAGIHLVLATQRPSVDVITGLIKANFPARISFQTTARVDSRTILDHIGAERLLGGGDMLYMPPGTARLQRLHGPLVTETEIHRVVNYVKEQGRPQYVFGLLENPEADEENEAIDDELDDELYDQAVRLVIESRQASISWVQRRLRIGYNRAARMIERMEREGVVSTSEGGRPREVLVPGGDGT